MLPFLVCSTHGGFKGFPVAGPAIFGDVAIVSVHSFMPYYTVAEGCTAIGWLEEANVSPVVEAETCTCSTSLCVVDS